jgi:poly-beta-1,6-N-acetyl-D-glucosamine synthase
VDRVLLITPARDEAAHLAGTIRAVAEQTRRPDLWLVIDDGSTDGTAEILDSLAAELPFIRVLQAPEQETDPVADRLTLAAEARAFNAALATVELSEFTHVGKLDADVELPPGYFERLLAHFGEDPELGIAGGVLLERSGRDWQPTKIPAYHVRGALKLYSRGCFEAIGGIEERLGWDTIDETYARMRGFTTWSYTDLVSIHHRPLGSADGTLRGHARHGECAYIAHYTTTFAALRAVKVGRRTPVILSGAAFFYGFARAAIRRVERVQDPEYRRFTHRELRGRMVGARLPRHEAAG